MEDVKDNLLLEPLDLYNKELKEKHNKNSIEYFDELVIKSGLKVEENRQTIQKYKKIKHKGDIEARKERKQRTIKIFMVIGMILFVFSSICLIYSTFIENIEPITSIPIIVFLVIITISFYLIIKKKINPRIKVSSELKEKFYAEAEVEKQIAWGQMTCLNELFDWNIASELVEKTTPLIQMDEYFDIKKFEYLKERYGLEENNDETVSTIFIQSGSIVGNPFLIVHNLHRKIVNHVYTGSIVIHWTETKRDSKGNLRTVRRSQTLTASVTKPRPDYTYTNELIYGNEAAPNLKFERDPSDVNGKNEKQIARMVKKGEKELEEKTREAITSGKTFVKLGNSEFDVLFRAHDRNNEVEYRLLFTPLAQKNMLKIIKSQVPYGDDFYFIKDKKINYIISKHSQNTNYYCKPDLFIGYDYDEVKKRFVDYNNNFFKSMFLDFAPLLSIPLYQQNKPKEYIYKNNICSNIPSYEHEALANSFNKEIFKHPDTATEQILKTTFIRKTGATDYVNVRSHSYSAETKVTYISKFGGDGHMHTIPVEWIQYDPIFNDSTIEVLNVQTTNKKFKEMTNNDEFKKYILQYNDNCDIIYERGLLSFFTNKEVPLEEIEKIKNYMKKEG